MTDTTHTNNGFTVHVTAEEADATLRQKIEQLKLELKRVRRQRNALALLALFNLAGWLHLALR